jgi:DHA2 family multidrug resistance protein
MLMAGRLVGKVDARLLVFSGIALMGFSLWQMSGFSLQMDSRPIIVSGVVQGLGLGLIFVPLQALAFGTLDPRHRTTAASLLNLSRNLGGSIGISMVTVMLARNIQVSHSDLASQVTPSSMPPMEPSLMSQLGGAGDSALALLNAEINRQAAMVAYIDDFYLMMLVTAAALPLVLLLKKANSAPPAAAMD